MMRVMETHLAAVAMIFLASVGAYTNHTVGGDRGWLFDVASNTSSANYTAWASSQTFSLGDYLIFNTTTNQTVIQTYNQTTYQNCTVEFAEDDGDTVQYGGGARNFGEQLILEVPLTIVGPNFFFSNGGGDDGVQCRNGMAFSIAVARGAGLPPSLNQPPPPIYAEPPGSDGGAESPPGTAVESPPKNGAFGLAGADVRRWYGALILLLLFLLLF